MKKTFGRLMVVASLLNASLVLTGCSGDTGAMGLTGATGANGIAGLNGITGHLVFGDGTGGALTVANGSTMTVEDPGSWGNTDASNTNFTSVTVAAGGTLNIESGTIIRCTGTFTKNGTINVVAPHNGGDDGRPADNGSMNFNNTYAFSGEYQPSLTAAVGGLAGAAPAAAQVSALYNIITLNSASEISHGTNLLLGGSGAGGYSRAGGNSGGAVTILAFGAISNAGSINADGEDAAGAGAGGGAGGILLFSSDTSITNAAGATISANGGNGGVNNDRNAPGGGGGGGIIHFHCANGSAAITGTGVGVSALAGAAGVLTAGTLADHHHRDAGGAGGTCAGIGGNGGSIDALDVSSAAGAAGAGSIIVDSAATLTALLFF